MASARAVARVDESRRVSLTLRRSKLMTSAFPGHRQGSCRTVDGEIVRWSSEGRLDFDALLRRNQAGRCVDELSRTEPCHYVVFDLLELDGHDRPDSPLSAAATVSSRG